MSPYRIVLAGLVSLAIGAYMGSSLFLQAQVIPQPSGAQPIGCAYNTTPPTLTDGQAGWVQCTSTGSVLTSGGGGGSGDTGGVSNADNIAGATGFPRAQAFAYVWDSNGANWDRLYGSAADGAWVKVTNATAPGRAAAAASLPTVPVAAASTAGAIVPNNTTAVVVKASAGTLFGAQIYGIGSAPAYLKIYNAASATCGSGTPVKRLMIPAAPTAANGAGSNVSFGGGLAFGTGITYCVTTGITDADTTAPAASTFLVNLDYE